LSSAGALALKLVLTPLLVGAASLAGRRWGSAVGGWLIGIPFTSAPIAFFLALDHGQRFASIAAVGILAGAASQSAFCLAYSWTAQRLGWFLSSLAATLAFGVATALLALISLPALALFVVMIVVLVVALFLMPAHSARAAACIDYPRWDIPVRMVVATSFVIVLTSAAPLLGARLAGLLALFPLYGAVLAAFAHRIQGAGPAVGVLRGLLLGLFAFTSFFLVLAMWMPSGIALAFGLAIAAALLVQGASLVAGRRLGLA
jgi:hypothetical protein